MCFVDVFLLLFLIVPCTCRSVLWVGMALTWFQGNRGLVVGLGCGVLLGMSGTLIVQQLSNGIGKCSPLVFTYHFKH